MNSWVIESLGWTLLHSLWQIGFITVILFSTLRMFKDFSANLRYLLSISALSLSLILPILTFVYFSNATNSARPIKQTVPTESKQFPIQETKKQIVSEKVDVPPMISADNTVSSPSSNMNLMPILVGFWLIGVMFFSIRLFGGIWTVHLYKTRHVSAVEAHWQTKFDEFCEILQIRQKVQFLQSKKVEIPMVLGWLKPVVLVPASAFLQISPKELETILIHELLHIKRHDYLVNFLQSLVEILFFYHPCVWWISAKIKAEREFAVDEFISQMFETERFIYAKALASLEEIRLTKIQATPNLAMAANGGNLMKRIENILQGNRKINSTNISIWSAIFAITFIVGISAGIYWLQMGEVKKSKTGRKVAVIINAYTNKKQVQVDYQNILDLQKKYEIPATWIMDDNLIDTLKQNNSGRDFFRQAKETNSNFILNIPNMDSTIYRDGLESYTPVWNGRIQFVNSNLAEYGDKLKFYTTYSNQIPQPMEDYLKENQISLMPPYPRIYSGFIFDYIYEKHCTRIENLSEKKFACRDTNESEKQELHEKYLQYKREIYEYREIYGKEKFGVEVPQTLSLFSGDLTKDSADELIKMLQDKEYEFIPFDEAFVNETNKFQESLLKDSKLSSQELQISRKYLPIDQFPFNKKTESPNEKKKEFKVDINTKDLKIIEN